MAATRAAWVRPPWLVAGILVVVAAALGVTVFAVLPTAKDHHRSAIGNSALSSDERAAMQAARVETVNLLTYARKTFDADWARALSGATGQLKGDLQTDKKTTLENLTKNKFDVTATVSDVALAGGDAKSGYQVLVVASGHRVDDSGTPSAAIPSRLQLTMTEVHGKWLASDLVGGLS
jgi:Mce-associated membrane protein